MHSLGCKLLQLNHVDFSVALESMEQSQNSETVCAARGHSDWKVPGVQAQGLEFDSQNSCKNPGVGVHFWVTSQCLLVSHLGLTVS